MWWCIFHTRPLLFLYSIYLISNRVNFGNELCKTKFSKISVKSCLAKPLSDHLSDLTSHSRHRILWHTQVPQLHGSAPHGLDPKRSNQSLTKGQGLNPFPLLPANEAPHPPNPFESPSEGEVPHSCHECQDAVLSLPAQTEICPKPGPTPLKNTYPVLPKLVGKGIFIKSGLLKEISL